MKHDPIYPMGPCRRCGLKLSKETAYVPCLYGGEPFGTWLNKQHTDVRALAIPAILARTNPTSAVTERWRRAMAELDVPKDVIEQNIEYQIREFATLAQGKCPKCGAPCTRYVDMGRQQGPTRLDGIWVQWRCSTQPPPGNVRSPGTCNFMLDLKEDPSS